LEGIPGCLVEGQRLEDCIRFEKEVWYTSGEFLVEEAILSDCVVETLKWDPANAEQWNSCVN
jgi:hypothetical protein